MSAEYDWSYIRSELNANDIHMIDNRLLVLYNSFIVEYDVDGNEIYRYDLKVEHNLGLVEDFEVDLENNIWLFSKDGSIYVLDDNYQLIKNFTYLNIDSSSKCLNLYIDDEAHYLCTYIKDSELGILSFSYDMMNRPIYQDYFVIDQGVIPDEVTVDLDQTSDNIFLNINDDVYYANKESNLKLPESWTLYDDIENVLSLVSTSELFILASGPDNLTIEILDEGGNHLQSLDYSSLDFVDIISINNNLVRLLLQEEIVLLNYDSDLNQFSFDSSYTLDSGKYTHIDSYDDYLIASISNQGFQIIPFNDSRIHVTTSSPSIDGYTSIKLLDGGGGIAAGININGQNSYASTLHFYDQSYINYIPTNKIDEYNLESEFDAVSINYVAGNFSPLSIVELDNNNIIFTNSGVSQNSDNSGGLIQINLDTQEIVNIFNTDNTQVLGGLDGVYNSDWDSNYMVINQIIEYNGTLYIVNPYNEHHGNIISFYDVASGQWGGLNASDEDLYLPEEMAFDARGQMWIAFDNENTLSGNAVYSSGGIRYVNENNEFVIPGNNSELVGGENVDALSLDVCRYNGFDILWVLTTDGVQGYTIHQNQLAPISSSDFFIESQFSKGDHIRCDYLSNVWVTTRHSGVRVILSASNYTEYWPSYLGFREADSGLLSDIVYDVDFNQNTGEVYFATDLGISILDSPFREVSDKNNQRHDIKFSKNPFLTPKDEVVIISNFPIGSTIKIMNLRGRVLHTLQNNNFSEYQWDGKDKNGNYLSSGVYIVTSSHPDKEKGIGKLAIIREK